jgi:apolipoprotein N-acyltransferase
LKNNIIFIILSALSAVLLLFSFAPFNLSFLAWFAFVPLFFLLPVRSGEKELTAREIFASCFLSGLIFWSCHISWLTYVTFPGYCLLVIYLASFLGLFGLLLKFLREKTDYPLIFIAPPLWVLLEFIRTYFPIIGFPWSLLGYSQWQNIPLIQISSVTGVYGVSFLIVMFNAAIADFIFAKTKRHFRNLLLSLLILTGIVIYGHIISVGEEGECRKIKISAIQGNIAQDIKWDEEYAENIVNIYAELSIYAETDPDISLVIWPETSYPDYVDIDSALFKKIQTLTRYLGIPLLMGAVTQQNGRDYNSALLISPDGEIKQVYNKLHLVPFGEYTPFKKLFFFLNNTTPQIGDFSKGTEYTVFQTPITDNRTAPFSVLICFEDLFPDLSRNFAIQGAEFLVVITNDAHFHESPALWQHFTHSVFRAVENRRPVVRAANNGISGFIDSYGRPIKILDENGRAVGIRGYATSQISPSFTNTFYTRFGDLFVYLNIFYLSVVLMIILKKNMKKL